MQDTHQLALPCGWWNVIGHVLIEHDQPSGISLLRRHVGERSGEVARVIQFPDVARSISHGRAGVEQDEQLHVRFALESLQVETLAAGEDVPIDVAQVVALHILLVFGELLGETEFRGTMQARDEAIHHRLRDEVERRDGSEDRGIEKRLQHILSLSGNADTAQFLKNAAARPTLAAPVSTEAPASGCHPA